MKIENGMNMGYLANDVSELDMLLSNISREEIIGMLQEAEESEKIARRELRNALVGMKRQSDRDFFINRDMVARQTTQKIRDHLYMIDHPDVAEPPLVVLEEIIAVDGRCTAQTEKMKRCRANVSDVGPYCCKHTAELHKTGELVYGTIHSEIQSPRNLRQVNLDKQEKAERKMEQKMEKELQRQQVLIKKAHKMVMRELVKTHTRTRK